MPTDISQITLRSLDGVLLAINRNGQLFYPELFLNRQPVPGDMVVDGVQAERGVVYIIQGVPPIVPPLPPVGLGGDVIDTVDVQTGVTLADIYLNKNNSFAAQLNVIAVADGAPASEADIALTEWDIRTIENGAVGGGFDTSKITVSPSTEKVGNATITVGKSTSLTDNGGYTEQIRFIGTRLSGEHKGANEKIVNVHITIADFPPIYKNITLTLNAANQYTADYTFNPPLPAALTPQDFDIDTALLDVSVDPAENKITVSKKSTATDASFGTNEYFTVTSEDPATHQKVVYQFSVTIVYSFDFTLSVNDAPTLTVE